MNSASKNLLKKLKKLKLIAFDFDGIFTDGKVITNQDGIERILYSSKDDQGIKNLKKQGLRLVVISKEPNSIVAIKCKKTGIEYAHNILDKLSLFKKILHKYGIKPSEAAFMGDDFNDLECMRYAGVSFTVVDAYPACLDVADYTTKSSGNHTISEIVDLIIGAKQKAHSKVSS
ncbi:MAG: hypothetical protein A2649_01145 [Candidatus Yanofskybacteria bacterium RIFCSPHIGHO2_01_FULL_41_26]|uniref:3-deoxy-D-manno-octulosonate 8-phosphate phosphatase n=1 Tax=Candidatus Yanofskybacteria bacterium RIFCSPHIGHO2_01_FULL_41_26 TaxID=1802661 RepID=A0A1F8EDK3_9BACT|nr:MAG: hypothetical protein A2649_01145 [Candidatus Yanofskybacteria bacterium RIFCSPHIGHO2_01_FULL_41_26]